jgi:hypothetical protein
MGGGSSSLSFSASGLMNWAAKSLTIATMAWIGYNEETETSSKTFERPSSQHSAANSQVQARGLLG